MTSTGFSDSSSWFSGAPKCIPAIIRPSKNPWRITWAAQLLLLLVGVKDKQGQRVAAFVARLADALDEARVVQIGKQRLDDLRGMTNPSSPVRLEASERAAWLGW
jgi:hypothetical protein